MYTNTQKNKERLRRKESIRKKVHGTSERPRLSVFRSLKHISVQVINDDEGRTLLAVYSNDKTLGLTGKNKEVAEKVGEMVARKALEMGIKQVVFDRSGYLYHGRVKILADSARKAGLDF
jgi:large subunit ribosomal protein L18